tara:strand:- start:2 stop:565 length:564 start_codon:yes stop_codon:yes gene_type:complete
MKFSVFLPFPTLLLHASAQLSDDSGDSFTPFDFDHCLPGEDGGEIPPSPDCTFMQTIPITTSLFTFQSCTGWSLLDVVGALLDSVGAFEGVIASCSGGTDTDADAAPSSSSPTACVDAISDLASGDNPLATYVYDLYTDPEKYCGCNTNLGSSLPGCVVQFGGAEIDLTRVQTTSCLFEELCEEYER